MAVLDSSFLIDLLRNKKEAVDLLEELENKEDNLFIATPTVMELWEGALRSKLIEQEKTRVENLLAKASILPFNEREAKKAAEINITLIHNPIQTHDVMIAGAAMTHGEAVVTRDAGFTLIPGLKVLKY